MTVVAPPPQADPDERALDDRVAELEALIEEARQRTRRRRRRNAGIALAALLAAGVALYAGGAGSRVGAVRSAEGDAVPAAALDRAASWSVPSGPPGFGAAVVLHPSKPGWVYLNAGGRVFRSTDAGRTWAPGRAVDGRLAALAVDHRNGSILYAGTGNGVLKSKDAGRTWRRMGLAPPPARLWHARLEGWVGAILVDPADSRIVYATARSETYRSPDSGRSWRLLRGAPGLSALAVGPSGSTTLYATVALPSTDGKERSAIMRSTDRGRTWRTVARRDGNISSLAVDPARPGTIWAAGTAGVIVTRDGGTTWREAGRPPARYLGSVLVDPSRADTLYVSTWSGAAFTWRPGLLRSTDGARTWQAFGTGLHELLAIDPRTPGTMYAGDGYGVVKTANGGATWRRADAGIAASSLNDIAAAPSNAATVYAGGSNGLSRSDDRGRTWTGLRTDGVASLAVDPRDHRHVLVGAAGIVASRDGGAAWTTVLRASATEYKEVRAIAFDAQNSSVVFAGFAPGGLARSSDGGRSWLPVSSGIPGEWVFSLAVDPVRAGTVFAGGSGGVVARSTDGGLSWTTSRALPGATEVGSLALTSDGKTLYAVTDLGLAKSVDGGARWTRVSADRRIRDASVVVDPRRAETLYAATKGAGVLRSTDGGVSWRPFGTRLPSRSVGVLAFDGTGTLLYASTNRAGLTSIRVR